MVTKAINNSPTECVLPVPPKSSCAHPRPPGTEAASRQALPQQCGVCSMETGFMTLRRQMCREAGPGRQKQ